MERKYAFWLVYLNHQGRVGTALVYMDREVISTCADVSKLGLIGKKDYTPLTWTRLPGEDKK